MVTNYNTSLVQKNITLVYGNAGDENNLHLGGRKVFFNKFN